MPDEKHHVLIVDDNSKARTFAAAVLTRNGYEVTEAGDPARAVEALRSRDFAVVLLDLKMPHNGVAMIDFISENLPAVLQRTIILTPNVNRPVFGILPKPFQAEPLLSAVKSCCDQK